MRTRPAYLQPQVSAVGRLSRRGRRAAGLLTVGGLLAALIAPATPVDADTGISLTGVPEIDAHVTTDADPAKDSAAFTIEGTLTHEDGTPLRKTPVQVGLDASSAMLLAAETTEGTAAGLPLGTVSTDDEGGFRLRVPALRDIDSYVDPDSGTVYLLFVSFGPDHAVFHRLDVELPTRRGERATTTIDDERLFAPSMIQSAQDDADDSAELDVTRITLTATRLPSGSDGGAMTMSSRLCTDSFGYSAPWMWNWRYERSLGQRTVPLQKITTKSRMTATYEYERTNETSTTTALDLKFKGVKTSGGYTKSIQQAAGVTFNVDKNTTTYLKAVWNFREYRLFCADGAEGPNARYRDANVLEGRMYSFAGGGHYSTTNPVTCSGGENEAKAPPNGGFVWAARSATHTATGSFGLSGVSIDSKHSNANRHKRKYHNPSKSNWEVCGHGGSPLVVDRVREK